MNASTKRCVLRQTPLAICLAAALSAATAAAIAPSPVISGAARRQTAEPTSPQFPRRHLHDLRRSDPHGRVPPTESTTEASPLRMHAAASLPVTSCADDSDPGTLRNVIATASSGDTVDASGLACSTITLEQGAIVTTLADLTIAGPGQTALTVDGAGADRVLVHDGAGTFAVSDLTLAHGSYVGATFGLGGCVYSIQDVALTNVTVTGCSTMSSYNSYGGGVMARGNLTLTSSTISDNRVSGGEPWGGGAYAGGNILATDSIISGNTATGTGGGNNFVYGGGLTAVQDITLTGSTVSGNTATIADGDYVFGGGAALGGNIELTDSTISGNVATAPGTHVYGGGFSAFYNATVASSIVDNNRSDRGGGGIMMLTAGGLLDITDSTISSNTALGVAHGGGGGITTLSPLALRNSTVAFNSATAGGGGILFLGADDGLQSQSSIIASNEAGAEAIYSADLGAAATLTVTGANNLVETADGTLPADTLRSDPMLLPLANNGGSTRTHALSGSSPALDTGNNAAALEFDQRGPGFPRVAGAAADIGAFELQGGASTVPPNVAKGFAPASITPGDSSVLTITLGNSNATPATLEAPLVDTLPSGLVVANPANAATTCPGGSVDAGAGTSAITLGAGAQIPAAGLCTVTVSVTADAAGTYTNVIPAGSVQTDLGNSEDPATAQLTVGFLGQPPSVTMFFTPDEIPVNGVATWTLTLSNPNDQAATLTADMLVGPFGTHVAIADPSGAATTCPGGVVNGSSGAHSFTLNSGAQIPAQGTCAVDIDITVDAVSTSFFFFPAGTLQTDIGSNPDTAEATLLTEPMVTPGAGAGGAIAPDTPQLVHEGDPADFTLTPDAGFHIAGVDGTCGGSLNGNVFTTFPVLHDCTVDASFASDVVDRIFADGFDNAIP